MQEADPNRCANCNGTHEAMDRSCPKRADFIRMRQQSSNPKSPVRKAEKAESSSSGVHAGGVPSAAVRSPGRSLDYERKSLYQLRILAKDRAIQGRVNTGTAALLVKVKDVEDQLPEFILVSSVTRIAEDAPVGTEVTAVKAIDGDRGVNNRIQYSIVENDGSPFSIDRQTGAIVTTAKLDREDTRNRMRAAYILEIVATEVCDVEPAPLVKTELTILITDMVLSGW
ncbi:hypothetical protein pipiens_014963 [Culex pipiens pipiens]|uniref:Cadherin domain-containing protein n=1 Tax=Culex pipiens pipiens TaxID=38569 RepID=A0ABD1CSE8_CULPP